MYKVTIMARNKELNQKMKDERKEQILISALRLFATKGLAATKITDIAEATGMSQGLVYHYYKSKEEIFTELIETTFDKINEASYALEAMAIPSFDKIKLAIETILKNLEDNSDHSLYYLFTTQATASVAIPEEAKIIMNKKNMIPYQVLARIIAKGQEEGTVKAFDPDQLALAFWASIKGLAITKALHGDKFKTPDPEIIINMFTK